MSFNTNPDLTTDFLVKWLRSTWMRRTAEKALESYERELLNYPALMHQKEKFLIKFKKEKKLNSAKNDVTVKNDVSVKNDVDICHEKDFDEMTIDELIWLYWQVDESASSQEEDNICNVEEEPDIEYTSLGCEEKSKTNKRKTKSECLKTNVHKKKSKKEN